MNDVFLIGRVGESPKNIASENGGMTVVFSLATNESFTDKLGCKVEQTDWHNIVVFNPLASVVLEKVVKGQKLMIKGRLTYRKYVDSKGIERQQAQILIKSLDF